MTRRPAILVLGRPCAGKSTVARWLATALGRRHVSVGELIREAWRTTPAFRSSNSAAYHGHETFAPEVVAQLLANSLAALGCELDETVVDGGPPMDQVFALLGARSPVTLVLCVEEEQTELRFHDRARVSEMRQDDLMPLFRERGLLYQRQLPGVVERLAAQGPVHMVDATTTLPGVLRQAASALLLPYGSEFVPATEEVPAGADWSRVVTELRRRSQAWGTALRSEYRPGSVQSQQEVANEPILLIKPGFLTGPALVEELAQRAAVHGYRITQAAVWPGEAIRKAGAVRAHLDYQYLLARWGDTLAPDLPVSGTLLPGYTFVSRYDQQELDAVWQEQGPVPPRRVADGCWIHPCTRGTDRWMLLNGHVPRHVERYEQPDATVTALRLRAQAPHAASWRTMREVFLGTTDPTRAHATSLRASAWRGELALKGEVSFRNNAFHLSRGPLEAVREAMVWLGEALLLGSAPRERDSYPGPLGRVDGPLMEGQSWAYATTAECDTDDPQVRQALGLMASRVTNL